MLGDKTLHLAQRLRQGGKALLSAEPYSALRRISVFWGIVGRREEVKYCCGLQGFCRVLDVVCVLGWESLMPSSVRVGLGPRVLL